MSDFCECNYCQADKHWWSEDYYDLEKSKDQAYSERDKLVALISKLYPASLERHEPEDDPNWEEEWKWIVITDLPTGQVSWHIHDKELPMFDHLPRKIGRKWDGHTTEQKYERIAAMESKNMNFFKV